MLVLTQTKCLDSIKINCAGIKIKINIQKTEFENFQMPFPWSLSYILYKALLALLLKALYYFQKCY